MGQLTIENHEKPFVYSAITCGSTIGNADKMLAKQLKEKDLHLSTVFSIIMPSNYVMMFDVKDEEVLNSTLQDADKQIDNMVKLLKDHTKGDFSNHGYLAPLTPIAYKLYGIYRKG